MTEDKNKELKEKLDQLIPIFANASIGNFSQDVPVLEVDDELAQTYAGIQIMLDVIRDKIRTLEEEIEIRKKAQRALSKRELRFHTTLDTMAEGFQIINFNWRYVFVNNAVSIQARRGKDELLGHTMMEIYPGIEKTEMFANLKRCMEKRISYKMENEFFYPDGSSNWFELRVEPVTEGILIFSLDINKQKKIRDEIAYEKAEDEALLESIGDGIIATDPEGKIILVNKAFETLLGWNDTEVMGKDISDIITMEGENEEAVPSSDHPIKLALVKGEKVTATYYLHRKDSTKFSALITATPVILDKKIIGAIKIFHDITRERELDEAKDEFISMASHELRTPMTAIKGLTSMILHGDYGPVNDELKRPLENISISSNRQIRLINDLLNVSRLQTGNMQYHLTNFSIKLVVNEVIESLAPIAQQNQITFTYEDIEDVAVQGDIDWVKQILNNLLGNALKFTDAGSITISTRTDKDFEFIMVIDTGAGIDLKDQEKLFERFRQLGNVTAQKAVGSGLGLYISRKVAREMGGDIRLERSEAGKGSTFVLSLPKANTANAEAVKKKLEKEIKIASNE